MKVLIINQAQVKRLLPMHECIDVMADALAALSRGEAIQPLRPILWLPEKVGALGMMPSFLSNIDALGVKVITVFPGNDRTEYDSHQGVVLLFEAGHGRLLGILDATSITAIRTAAVSGVATRLLARDDAKTLAILGSGVQASTHVAAMTEARKIERAYVWSRHTSHAQAFAEAESERFGLTINVAASAEEAVRGADIVCTTTSSREPVLNGEWLKPGCHINAVGSSAAFARELDTSAMTRARLFVDRIESTLNESGDFIIAKREGAFGDEHIVGEIGDVLRNKMEGRRSNDEITLFKSLGLGIEDLAAANHVYRKAIDAKVGTFVELGGERASA